MPHAGSERMDRTTIAALSVLSAAMAWALWGKLQTLLDLDPSWWLHEIARAARGELPDRDFAWHFPPLAVLLYGWWLRIFGIRFNAVQALMDLVSAGIVALSYQLLRQFVPRAIQFVTCLLLLAVCCTTQTYFSLFSLLGYNPALLTGAFGLLLLLNAAVRFVGDNLLGPGRLLQFGLGAMISLLSKPESMLASAGILALVIVFDPLRQSAPVAWLRRSVLLAAVCFLPSLIVYVWFAQVVGLGNLAAAISGYGLATLTCPWWPTGIGLWSGLAGLGAAAALVSLGSLSHPAGWRKSLGGWYATLWTIAILGFVLYLGYEVFSHTVNLSLSVLTSARLGYVLRSMAGTTDVFRAVLWPAILIWSCLLIRGLRDRGRLPTPDLKRLLFVSAPFLTGIRSLFGSVITPFPEVSAMCYPFVILVGPYLLYRALCFPGNSSTGRSAARFVIAVSLLYAMLRVIGGYSEILSNRGYTLLQTNAGAVRVRDGAASREVYDYVVQHTSASDGILELPYGGGLAFASGRSSPAYSTLFVQLHPPASIQALDVERMRAHPPTLVIAKDQPDLGTYYGIEHPVGCAFPRIVWSSEEPAGSPNLILPIVNYVGENYHLVERVGQWQILGHN